MRKILLSAVAALMLTGCTTFSDMDKGLGTYVGKPESYAFYTLGYPQQEGEIAGRKVYIWSSHFQMTLPQSHTSTTYGTVGTTPYSANTTTTTYQNYDYDCTIRLFVDPQTKMIVSYDFTGNIGGCMDYAHRLNSVRKKQKP